MNLRPLAAVATALACAFATPSAAGNTVALDGVRRTHATYKGQVTETAFAASAERLPLYPMEPAIEDCTTPESCDITPVRLTLPKGTTAGRFKVTVTMPRELNGAVALFDAEGERVAKADLLENNESICCTVDTWKASFVVTRMPAGHYTLVVFDRGGVGTFSVDLDYKALPPDRQRTRK